MPAPVRLAFALYFGVKNRGGTVPVMCVAWRNPQRLLQRRLPVSAAATVIPAPFPPVVLQRLRCGPFFRPSLPLYQRGPFPRHPECEKTRESLLPFSLSCHCRLYLASLPSFFPTFISLPPSLFDRFFAAVDGRPCSVYMRDPFVDARARRSLGSPRGRLPAAAPNTLLQPVIKDTNAAYMVPTYGFVGSAKIYL